MEERILLTIRNADDRREAEQRENVLSNLCQCYYSIYIFDLVNDTEKPIWQELAIHEQNAFPWAASLPITRNLYSSMFSRMIRKKCAEPAARSFSGRFSRRNSRYMILISDEFIPHGIEWVRSRFSISEMINGQVTKVIFCQYEYQRTKTRGTGRGAPKRNSTLNTRISSKGFPHSITLSFMLILKTIPFSHSHFQRT